MQELETCGFKSSRHKCGLSQEEQSCDPIKPSRGPRKMRFPVGYLVSKMTSNSKFSNSFQENRNQSPAGLQEAGRPRLGQDKWATRLRLLFEADCASGFVRLSETSTLIPASVEGRRATRQQKDPAVFLAASPISCPPSNASAGNKNQIIAWSGANWLNSFF